MNTKTSITKNRTIRHRVHELHEDRLFESNLIICLFLFIIMPALYYLFSVWYQTTYVVRFSSPSRTSWAQYIWVSFEGVYLEDYGASFGSGFGYSGSMDSLTHALEIINTTCQVLDFRGFGKLLPDEEMSLLRSCFEAKEVIRLRTVRLRTIKMIMVIYPLIMIILICGSVFGLRKAYYLRYKLPEYFGVVEWLDEYGWLSYEKLVEKEKLELWMILEEFKKMGAACLVDQSEA